MKIIQRQMPQNRMSTKRLPQGSVLGPLLFALYTADLEKIAASYNLKIYQYADDAHLFRYYSFDASMDLQERMSKCIDEH